MKVQWTRPAGWKHQTTPQAVAAAIPKDDAVLQLQTAGKMSPDEAAQKLFSQQGIKAGPPVNGKRAMVARALQAQSQHGGSGGFMSSTSYQGKTYMMAGCTRRGASTTAPNTFRARLG